MDKERINNKILLIIYKDLIIDLFKNLIIRIQRKT